MASTRTSSKPARCDGSPDETASRQRDAVPTSRGGRGYEPEVRAPCPTAGLSACRATPIDVHARVSNEIAIGSMTKISTYAKFSRFLPERWPKIQLMRNSFQWLAEIRCAFQQNRRSKRLSVFANSRFARKTSHKSKKWPCRPGLRRSRRVETRIAAALVGQKPRSPDITFPELSIFGCRGSLVLRGAKIPQCGGVPVCPCTFVRLNN